MKWITGLAFSLCICGCKSKAQDNKFDMIKELPKELKEISGIVRDGNVIWAISDNPAADIYKLDLSGNVLQQIHLNNISYTDVEAVTADHSFLYIGDVGDNDGNRMERKIIRILKTTIPAGKKVTAEGEVMQFTFEGDEPAKKKKHNDYDCEAMVSFKDSLYIFTKRRGDLQTELFALPKTPGNYVAGKIAQFDTKGLVTDASINEAGNELALIGYDPGHTKPFIWLFSNFSNPDFFTGNASSFQLTNKKNLDWQVEGITYSNGGDFFISCERTKDVTNTLYLLNRSGLMNLKKSR